MAVFDELSEAGDDERRFLRAGWFATAQRHVLHDENGDAQAAFALADRSRGPFRLREVGGAYWPYRGVPISPSASSTELAETLSTARSELGRVWRLGPIIDGHRQVETLVDAARQAGWRVLTRTIGQSFVIDLKALKSQGNWPSTKGAQKDRWRVRQMAKTGPVAIRWFSGTNWTAQDRDDIAMIEANSWIGQLANGGDTKFHDPAMRRYWETVAGDPTIAAMIGGMIMTVGDRPVAFTFGLDCGTTRYCIANNFDREFSRHSPGRVLLYADFEAAWGRGIERVDWGLGDAGYKSEMGARPDADMLDLLFVRGRVLPALLRRWWERAA